MRLTVLLDDVGLRPISHWIVADLDTVGGRALLYSAIKQLVQFDFCKLYALLQEFFDAKVFGSAAKGRICHTDIHLF